MRAFAGIDWAKDDHAVCVLDEHGRALVRRTVRHDERGLRALIELLRVHRVERIALERPDGLLVDRLLDARLVVLAELARTDSHRFRPLAGDCDQTEALRALTSAHQDAVWTRVALANQLRAELERVWPGATRIFAAIDSPIALAFLARCPSPTDAQRLTHRHLAALLRRQRYSGRRSPDELLTRLRSAPAGAAGPAEHAARRQVVLGLIAALRAIVAQIRTLARDIDTQLRARPDGPIFLSLFRTASLTAARLLAEIGDDRGRYQTNEALAAHAGASRHHHHWAHTTYARARGRGHDHPRALRTLARNWIRVLWRCRQDHTPYNPTHHGSLNRLITPTT